MKSPLKALAGICCFLLLIMSLSITALADDGLEITVTEGSESSSESSSPQSAPDTPVDTSSQAAVSLQPETAIPMASQNGRWYPTDIKVLTEGENRLLYKFYTIPGDVLPDNLRSEPFKQDGYRYLYLDTVLQSYTPDIKTKAVSQTISMDSKSKDTAGILAQLEQSIPYEDEEGYKGTLTLLPESITILDGQGETYSYTANEVRTFENLTRNDPAELPKTIDKNGATYYLKDISWRVSGTQGMGYSEIPLTYTATGTYYATITGTRVTEYTATARYSGEVTKEGLGQNTFQIVYEGSPVTAPVLEKPEETTAIPWGMAIGLIGIAFAATAAIFIINHPPKLRKKRPKETREPSPRKSAEPLKSPSRNMEKMQQPEPESVDYSAFDPEDDWETEIEPDYPLKSYPPSSSFRTRDFDIQPTTTHPTDLLEWITEQERHARNFWFQAEE